MAPVKHFLPTEEEFALLRTLDGRLRVCTPRSRPAGLVLVYLRHGEGKTVRLSVDYDDVVFKFECFRLAVNAEVNSEFVDAAEVACIENWKKIKCCFRFEWERPALPGEIRVDWEQVVGGMGRKSDVPADATAVCVSMVGVIFCHAGDEVPMAAITHDDRSTVELAVLLEPREIDFFAQGCEVIDLQHAPRWAANLT